MKKQAVNPYLPSWEYIPDGEPYVFGDRVYVYGSHDRFNGHVFCLGDYMGWSAPVNDLSDWRCEGVIYPKDRGTRSPHWQAAALLLPPALFQPPPQGGKRPPVQRPEKEMPPNTAAIRDYASSSSADASSFCGVSSSSAEGTASSFRDSPEGRPSPNMDCMISASCSGVTW